MISERPRINDQHFREVFASFPTGVAVVTAMGPDGEPRGLTCNSLCSVSADPPLVAVCLDKQSETLPAVRSAGSFVVNFLAAHQEPIARRFASKHPEKFSGLAWIPSEATGLPRLPDAVAHCECRILQTLDVGDHWMFIAEVLDGASDNDVEPLVYCRRGYGTRRQPT